MKNYRRKPEEEADDEQDIPTPHATKLKAEGDASQEYPSTETHYTRKEKFCGLEGSSPIPLD